MGRYARFSATTKDGEDICHEYKFWFGTQDSVIPWAEEGRHLLVGDYDDDQALEANLTLEQCKMWRDLEGQALETDDIREDEEFLRQFASQERYAEDDDTNLKRYWAETTALAIELGLEPFKPADVDCYALDTLDAWVEEQIDPADTDKCGSEHTRRLADLHLKTTICCILQDCGSYQCVFEC